MVFLVSRGDLQNGQNPTATAGGGGVVNFAWTNNAGSGKAQDTDKAIFVVYCPELQQFDYTTDGADRSEETASFDVSAFTGKAVQAWIGFISDTGTNVATSIYTGELTIT